MDVEWWDRPLSSRRGGQSRLGGLELFYEFDWLDEFPDQRAMFQNGTSLARLVKRECPQDLTPALLLTVRGDIEERSFVADGRYIAVINLRRIRAAAADPAISYFAARLGAGITSATDFRTLAADPNVVDAVVQGELTPAHVAKWAASNQGQLAQLRDLIGPGEVSSAPANLSQVFQALRAFESLDAEFVNGLEGLLDPDLDRESRLRCMTALAKPLLADGDALTAFIRDNREVLMTIIRSDVDARDIIALAHRRVMLAEFERLLFEDDYFAAQRQEGGGPEKVWQSFIEQNAWVIGSTLAPQFLHSWSRERLEQTVKGFSIGGPGKRSDAVLRTAGVLSALVLAEIKHHQTKLLGGMYRAGCWTISDELAGGVAQCQATADEASRELGKSVDLKNEDGYTLESIFVCRPRTVLVIGSLTEFVDADGNVHQDKFESFERFRRGLRDPELLTFDELFARARLLVDLAADAMPD